MVQTGVSGLQKAEAIVFDVGNVLLRFHPEKVAALIPQDVRKPMYEALWGPEHRWAAFDEALDPNEIIAERIAASIQLPKAKDTILYVLHHFMELMEPMPLYSQLERLKNEGKRLYALTNFPEPSFTLTCRRFPFLLDLLDGQLVSAREKLVKPDPRIFRLAAQRFSLNPEKTLFIDDSEKNVLSAFQHGFMIWHYTKEADAAFAQSLAGSSPPG